MPLTQDQEDVEHRMRVRVMSADIELKTVQARWEPWKVVVSVAAVFVSLGGVIGFFLGLAQHH